MLKRLSIGFIIVVMALYLFNKWLYADVVFSVKTQEKIVALSYDDGPNPGETEALLDLLDELDASVSFFLKGMNVAAHPDIAQQIYARGHEIGNHSWTHKQLISFSKAEMLEELQLTNDAIKAATGFSPVLYRPPFAMQGLGMKRALDVLNMKSIAANVSAADWLDQDPALLAKRVLEDIAPGDIIVLHDGEADIYDGREQGNRFGTVEATREIINSLRAQGYQVATVTQLLNR